MATQRKRTPRARAAKNKKTTQNSGRIENLKPFKSRDELGGQLDPRINVGGRPRKAEELLSGAYTKMLKSPPPRDVAQGLTKWYGGDEPQTNAEANAARMNMLIAQGNVPAVKEVRQATEGDKINLTNLTDAGLDKLITALEQSGVTSAGEAGTSATPTNAPTEQG